MVRLTRHPRGIVRQDQVVPAKMGDQPVAGGEIDPHRPFFRADMARSFRKSRFEGVHGSSPFRYSATVQALGARRIRILRCVTTTTAPAISTKLSLRSAGCEVR